MSHKKRTHSRDRRSQHDTSSNDATEHYFSPQSQTIGTPETLKTSNPLLNSPIYYYSQPKNNPKSNNPLPTNSAFNEFGYIDTKKNKKNSRKSSTNNNQHPSTMPVFYANPLEVSIQNELVDPLESDARTDKMLHVANEYRNLVNEYKNSKLETSPVLLGPDVQEKLAYVTSSSHKPYFMYTVIILQTLIFIYSYYKNYVMTGSLSSSGFPLYSQDRWTLIGMGARYYPCMRPGSISVDQPIPELGCAKQRPNLAAVATTPLCTIRDACDFLPELVPHQVYRFISAIFLHSGVFHYALNVIIFQWLSAVSIEKDIGSWRVGFIYLSSGIGGFLFTPSTPRGGEFNNVTVGASGAIYGLVSCILIDFVFSWKLLRRPKWELFKLLIKIFLSLLIGYLTPNVDNFSHLGGLVSGLFASALVLPSVHFGNWDKTAKIIIKILSLPLLLFYFIFNYYAFHNSYFFCPTCTFLGSWNNSTG